MDYKLVWGSTLKAKASSSLLNYIRLGAVVAGLGLRSLAEAEASRLPAGPLAGAFAALTADPLRGLDDLPRLQRELRIFRELPGRLEALRAASLVTR